MKDNWMEWQKKVIREEYLEGRTDEKVIRETKGTNQRRWGKVSRGGNIRK
jgi:hypothetical protein